MMKQLIVDHDTQRYEVRREGAVQRVYYRDRRVAERVADFYQWLGYDVVIWEDKKKWR